jgi:hypothetical protein
VSKAYFSFAGISLPPLSACTPPAFMAHYGWPSGWPFFIGTSAMRTDDIDEDIIDAVFDFIEDRAEIGDDPAQVVMGMLAVINMVRASRTDNESMH